jgi:tetratricopeptide (TPR) repeat protein
MVLAIAVFFALSGNVLAQRGKGSSPGKPPSSGGGLTSSSAPSVSSSSLLFISGKVLMEGGLTPPEPAVIEKICNGVTRRQGYTDRKGSYQIQIDQNTGFQDASESTNNGFSNDPQLNAKLDALKLQFQGCEFRAVLPGFLSSTVTLQLQGNAWQYDLPPIFLKPMEHAMGTTISMTTLNAPNDARRAYEKGEKEYDQGKIPEAEKELEKAVRLYPGFAAAWSLLGDIHQQQKELDEALKDYTQAAAADPQYVNPAFGLGLIAVQQKRWQDAIQLTDQVAKLNATAFPSTYFYNAVANYNLGRLEPAEASARKFISLDKEHKHPDIHLLLSQILTYRHDLEGAAQALRDYLSIAPGAANAPEVRGQLQRLEQANIAKRQ